MTQNRIKSKGLPYDVVNHLKILGEHIKIARKRRKLTMEEMASRMYVSRKTLWRLENGDPGVSLSVMIVALWVLGLNNDLLNLADPEKDKIGIFKERQNLPDRVRKTTKNDLDF